VQLHATAFVSTEVVAGYPAWPPRSVAAPPAFPVRSAADLLVQPAASRPSQILVVDDEALNVKLLGSLLRAQGYSVESATDGEAALAAVARSRPDLILLDVMMPGIDGFEVATRLKTSPHTKSIPIIMVTSLDDRASRLAALDAGAEDFLTKPIDRAELWGRVRNLLRLKEYADLLGDHARILEDQVNERTEQLTASYRDTISTLTRASSYRDEETGAHVQRISFYCVELAQTLRLDAAFCDCIRYASPMHDVGKIAIPDRILLKRGPLDADEWVVMKTHSALGAKMLEGGDSPYLRMGRDIALGHHERWDGTGYPYGLAGEATPLAARLMSIADVYDALRSERPYKQAYDHETAVAVITRGDGRTSPGHFDPEILGAFGAAHSRLRDIHASLADDATHRL
jgi:putative two-component system response regulator